MVKKIKLQDIKLNTDNPRYITEEKMDSIKQNLQGFLRMLAIRPIVVDENWVVLGGNQRLRALAELGHTEIPQEWVRQEKDLTDEEKRKFIILDNQPFGNWDYDILANDWDTDWLLEHGFTKEQLFGDFDPDKGGGGGEAPLGEKRKITLEYADALFEKVSFELLRRGDTYEEAVLNLLDIED